MSSKFNNNKIISVQKLQDPNHKIQRLKAILTIIRVFISVLLIIAESIFQIPSISSNKKSALFISSSFFDFFIYRNQ